MAGLPENANMLAISVVIFQSAAAAQHDSLFESSVRTRAFVHSPLFFGDSGVTQFQGLFHTCDWLPTIIEGLLQQPLDDDSTDGLNAWSGLAATGELETPTKVRESVLLNIDYLDDVTNDVTDGALGNKGEHAGVISGHWKLLVNEGSRGRGGEQLNYLFDLRNDPTETNNVISSNIAVVKGLTSLLWGTYYPNMVPSEWAPPYSGAYQVWDTQEAFVGPWNLYLKEAQTPQ
eukprot:FR742049.1.p1 GENE.FR742049.1~~FR742049.1.p1  ORF type:complete len:232 (-),score=21.36 FR742049.1:116-811(-)